MSAATWEGGCGAGGALPCAQRSGPRSLSWVAALALALPACCGQAGTSAALDAGHAATVRACLGAEQAALRASQSREAWEGERDRLRLVCDATLAAWEAALLANAAAESAP